MKVTLYPSKVLFSEANEVSSFTSELVKLADDMVETMRKYDGVGLAGPQVDRSSKIIIVHTPDGDKAFVNPKITWKSKQKEEAEEGCLSLPGLFTKIRRAKEMEVRCQTIKGEHLKLRVSGFTSRIFQHEIDHVEGRLIIHRVPLLRRMRFRKKLKEISQMR